MKAVAISPRVPHSVRIVELPMPKVNDVPGGRGVLVQVLQVGVDGTDKELYLGEYGAAPQGEEFLVPGHESIGKVVEVGPEVVGIAPGDYVVATVRRPGNSLYDQIGIPDMSTDVTYYERGINFLHGFLAEYYVDDYQYIVKVPPSLTQVGVLLEPMSIVEKGLEQAFEVQRRLKVWNPSKAAVMGAGPIGLLATLALRLRDFEVVTFARTPKPNLKASLVEAIGAHYVSLQKMTVKQAAKEFGPFDLIFEATGYSPLAFESVLALKKNAVLILTSVTSGKRKIEIDSDYINLSLVLGNQAIVGIVASNRNHFQSAIRTFAQAEHTWPGWLSRLLTHPVKGLENYKELYQNLFEAKDAIKVFMNVN